MTVDVTTPAEAPTPKAPTIKDVARDLTLIGAYKGTIADVETVVRADFQSRLLDMYHETGTKQIVVKADDGEEIATWSVTGTAAKDEITVTDEQAFEDWVLRNHPTEVETVVQVRPAFKDQLLKDLEHADGVFFSKATGEPVEIPGVEFKHTPAGEPTGVKITWKPGTKAKPSGKERAAAIIRQQGVADLPAIEG